jgi:hypothetical protein
MGHENVLLSHKLTSVRQEKDGWSAIFESPTGSTKVIYIIFQVLNLFLTICFQQISSKALLLCSPAYVTSEILLSDILPAAWELKSINYPPVASVTLAYPNSAFKASLNCFCWNT